MKKLRYTFLICWLTGFSDPAFVSAQEQNSVKGIDMHLDIYSNYIWRGSKLGTGPAFQPNIKYSVHGFSAGVWGSFDGAGYTETDPYLSYLFPFGLSIGFISYYLPGAGGSFFSDSTNAAELNAGFTKGGFNISANYILNKAPVPASYGSDKYFQAGWNFTLWNFFVGGGDGWHTSTGKFKVCNIGLGTIRQIKISGTLEIPLNGQIILNPDKKQLFIVAGISI